MAQPIIWSEAAVEDLEATTAFIAKDSLHYASAFAREVLDASSTLSQFQTRGRIVPEVANPDIRELFIRDYRLIYRIAEKKSEFLVLYTVQGIFRHFGLQNNAH
jgi:plasmid stabilization system protein ParE